MTVSRRNVPAWQNGPQFKYSAGGKELTVNVVGSSLRIQGVPLATPVRDALIGFNGLSGLKVLDFGAGSWLRYADHLYNDKNLSPGEVYAVEFDEAFLDKAAAAKKKGLKGVKFLTPASFEEKKRQRVDLILVINVINTMPEEKHRRQVFKCLSERLNPLGRLIVYQRIWDETENPPGALSYGDGWLIPQPHHSYYTYRANTGATWFNELAKKCKLKPLPTARISSGNTLFKIWEKEF